MKNTIDIPKLKASTSPLTVASALLGPQDMRRTGGKYQIRCMFHPIIAGKEDKNIGNCFLTSSGCHCTTCGSHDIFEMVRAVYPDYSFLDAVKFVAELNGGLDNFTAVVNEKRSRRIPPKAFLQRIGLDIPAKGTEYQILGEMEFTMENLKKPHVRVPDEKTGGEHLYAVSYQKPMSLSRLFYEDPDTFKWLVKNKCNETIINIRMDQIRATYAEPEREAEIEEEVKKQIKEIKDNFYKYLAS